MSKAAARTSSMAALVGAALVGAALVGAALVGAALVGAALVGAALVTAKAHNARAPAVLWTSAAEMSTSSLLPSRASQARVRLVMLPGAD
jgi:hypothetical protein